MIRNKTTTFDKIIIGRKFKTSSGAIYRKSSVSSAVPVNKIESIDKTSLFYKSNIPLQEVI
jgi:hypothetical protein